MFCFYFRIKLRLLTGNIQLQPDTEKAIMGIVQSAVETEYRPRSFLFPPGSPLRISRSKLTIARPSPSPLTAGPSGTQYDDDDVLSIVSDDDFLTIEYVKYIN